MSRYQGAIKNPSTAKANEWIIKKTTESIQATFMDNKVEDSVRLELGELWKRNLEEMGLQFDNRPTHCITKDEDPSPMTPKKRQLRKRRYNVDTTDVETQTDEGVKKNANTENEISSKEDEPFFVAEYSKIVQGIGETKVTLKGGGVLHVNGKDYVIGRGEGTVILFLRK